MPYAESSFQHIFVLYHLMNTLQLFLSWTDVQGLDDPARAHTKEQTTSHGVLLTIQTRTQQMQIHHKRHFADVMVLIESQLDDLGRLQ